MLFMITSFKSANNAILFISETGTNKRLLIGKLINVCIISGTILDKLFTKFSQTGK